MSNEQQAGIIEHLPVESLKPHPKNIAVYGKDGYGDLVDSIRELGVMQALCVTPQRVIISGHRRRKSLGLTQDDFAVKLGVAPFTVRRWESGKTKPSRMAQRLLKEFEQK